MTAVQLALGVDAEPIDPDQWARRTIHDVISGVAYDNAGIVDPNIVRHRLAVWNVPPRLVGQTYRVLRLAGTLVPDGWVVSDDVKGGNNGKPARRYRWVARP